MIVVDHIRNRVLGHSLVRAVDATQTGFVRIETAFLHPEGGNIDLLVVVDAPLIPTLRLSDLGQTYLELLDLRVRPWLSKKRQAFVVAAPPRRRTERRRAGTAARVARKAHTGQGASPTSQRARRRFDPYTAKRASVARYGRGRGNDRGFGFGLHTGAELEGRFGNRVRVDSLVTGTRTSSAILTLFSPNSTQAHIRADETFRHWYDMDTPERNEQRITIFDERLDTYRPEDLRFPRDRSLVMPVSDRMGLRDLLAA